jgi:uncharacterized protein YndB with AHSA1/START domain
LAGINPASRMPHETKPAFPADRELVIQRVLQAPREKLFRCWTTPELITQWFTPPPWKTVAAVMDVGPGGASCVTMQSPEGQEFPNRGLYLEVVPNERLVFTDAFMAPGNRRRNPS